MSDNFAISTASGERTIASDQISEVDFVRNKLVYGPDGTNTGDVQLASTTAGGLPVQANLCSDYIMVGGLGLAPKWNVVAITATSASQIAAVSGKKLRIIAVDLSLDTTAGTVLFESSGGTDLTGTYDLTSFGSIRMPLNIFGWFETASGEGLTITLATANNLDGVIQYIEV